MKVKKPYYASRKDAKSAKKRIFSFPEESKVLYRSKDGNVFDAMGWLAAMCSHVPTKSPMLWP